MVPLQEHQRPAPVLMQQLLFALLQGQLSLSDLLALHRASTQGNGLHHVIYTGGLSPAHALYDQQSDDGWQVFVLHVCEVLLVLVVSPGSLAVLAAVGVRGG